MEVNYSGIKCDCCDYRDDHVQFSDYKDYINRPCPKCRENLLTEEDYKRSLQLIRAVTVANRIVNVLKWLNPLHYYRLIFGDKRNYYDVSIKFHNKKN
jgi:hypothetical protein